jgi:hypothetical protein
MQSQLADRKDRQSEESLTAIVKGEVVTLKSVLSKVYADYIQVK